MIYLFSDSNDIKSIFENDIEENEIYSVVERDDFHFNTNIKSEDILILDIDNFDSLDEVMYYFIKLPKILKVIAFIKEPKLSHGAFLVKKGFKSYIGKDTDKSIIKIAIDSVSNGNVWLYPQLMNFIIQHISIEKDEIKSFKLLENLSEKEKKVANLVSNGLSNKEIAEKLDVQVVTIKKHIGHIFTKLEIKDRLSLALYINKSMSEV